MKSIYRQLIQAVVTPLLAIFLATTGAFAADWPPGLDKNNPKVQAVMAMQNRHTPDLMTKAGVVGTAVGQAANGEVALLVLTETAAATTGLPDQLEGVPVVKLVTGKIKALKRPAPGTTIDPTTSFPIPVPIGVSTGNVGECSAGTIGARVKKNGNVYALSNNHVYALENAAQIDSNVVQPGRYDTGCSSYGATIIGKLSDYKPIDFSGGINVIDAALALSDIDRLDNATPSNGYGKPNSTTVGEELSMPVQKYGRTSSLTKGKIAAINVTVNVGYTKGVAIFENQILVTARKAFIKAGDSGSLLVTDNLDSKPVGLLFAGDSSGRYAFANPIGPVLEYFKVSIDGK